MSRRRKRLILLIAALVAIAVAGVFFFLWQRGAFIPNWVVWNERVEADDAGAEGVVESVVLKERGVVVYSAGAEIYRSPSGWLVQDALWKDVDGDDVKEALLLCWTKTAQGIESETLTTSGGVGYRQHIAIFDGASEGMNELWYSAPLAIEAAQWRFDDMNRLIITEPQGRQTLWIWDGEGLVPAR